MRSDIEALGTNVGSALAEPYEMRFPHCRISATSLTNTENSPADASFTHTRPRSNFTLSGTAVRGSDYLATVVNSITIPAGERETWLEFAPTGNRTAPV